MHGVMQKSVTYLGLPVAFQAGDSLRGVRLSVLNEKMTYVTCEALSNVVVRRLSRGGLIQFLTRYPGLMVQLLDTRILTLEGIE